MTRKEKYNRKSTLPLKILIGVLFLSVVIAGNIGVAFADQDISGLLSSWFNKKGQESIVSIESAIAAEKETQKLRLKEELQSELLNASERLNRFTEEEKQNRIQALRDYANQLIAGMKVDNSEEEKRIASDLDKEIDKAIKAMDKIKPKGK
ncbi:hypothetical protein [Bacillus sp. FJAT-27445]|uniref:hypothetical protein n=1 Tax=Bacillus sp. FJAT-27445 TaxID=1679166 RepID=UPI0007440DBE|nr:hypothetical protein [Bacillus sp. FJAT-27445]